MSSVATTPLIPKQVEKVMVNVTLNALGILSSDPLAYSKVRMSWQTLGQPANSVAEDVVYVRAIEEDNDYNQVRDLSVANDGDAAKVDLITEYTRAWRVSWVIYGPNSFDHARLIKSAVLQPSQPIHDLLVEASLYAVPDIPAPIRAPENFQGEWWERVDLSCLFYEGVSEIEIVSAIKSTEIITETVQSVVTDVTVTGS